MSRNDEGKTPRVTLWSYLRVNYYAFFTATGFLLSIAVLPLLFLVTLDLEKQVYEFILVIGAITQLPLLASLLHDWLVVRAINQSLADGRLVHATITKKIGNPDKPLLCFILAIHSKSIPRFCLLRPWPGSTELAVGSVVTLSARRLPLLSHPIPMEALLEPGAHIPRVLD